MKSLLAVLAVASILFAAHASETVKGVKKDLQNFKQEMNIQLDQAQQNLEVLKLKSQDKITAAGHATVNELEATKEQLKARLESMKADSVKASQKVKNDLATSISSLNERIQRALKE